MFINPISMNHKSTTPAFQKGLNPEVARNQYKILLTQDIWAEKLKVKQPENSLEKEVLLEILQNRLRLDRFARLNNLLAKLKTQVSYINSLFEQDPSNPELPSLIQEVKKQGNLDSIYKTLHKQIEREASKNKPFLDYFKNIEKLEDDYLEKHLMKYSKMEKFWYQINKNNINKDGNYMTQDLIDIVTQDKLPDVKSVSQPLSKKQLLEKITTQYENILLENLNIYSEVENHTREAYKAKQTLAELNIKDLKRFPDIAKQVGKICTFIENKITYQADKLGDIDIYPIGTIMEDMKRIKFGIKEMKKDIVILKNKIIANPDNQALKTELATKEKDLEEAKCDWEQGLKAYVEFEKINHQRMTDGGYEKEYSYLTTKSKELNKFKDLYNTMKNSNNKIPENLWDEILL